MFVLQGVRCFHLDHTLKILVTGSKDSVVRLWNPVMTNKPVISLFGHKSAVVDVRIFRNLTAVLSMSKDAVSIFTQILCKYVLSLIRKQLVSTKLYIRDV